MVAGRHGDPVARFLFSVAVILLVCHVFGALLRRFGQPAVLGELKHAALTPARAASTSSVLVLTTIPSVHTVEHDVCSLGIFSILTIQTRQEPSMLMPG